MTTLALGLRLNKKIKGVLIKSIITIPNIKLMIG